MPCIQNYGEDFVKKEGTDSVKTVKEVFGQQAEQAQENCMSKVPSVDPTQDPGIETLSETPIEDPCILNDVPELEPQGDNEPDDEEGNDRRMA
jgi:hypothetical protein